jgi:hypothetical protein
MPENRLTSGGTARGWTAWDIRGELPTRWKKQGVCGTSAAFRQLDAERKRASSRNILRLKMRCLSVFDFPQGPA